MIWMLKQRVSKTMRRVVPLLELFHISFLYNKLGSCPRVATDHKKIILVHVWKQMQWVHTYPMNKMELSEIAIYPVKNVKHPICTASSSKQTFIVSKDHLYFFCSKQMLLAQNIITWAPYYLIILKHKVKKIHINLTWGNWSLTSL